MITRYRKRPVEVDTIQWTGNNEAELVEFTGHRFERIPAESRAEKPDVTAQVYDELHDTWVGVKTGQHIVRGVQGEFYPIAEDVLAKTYEPAQSGPTPAAEETVPLALFEENARRHKSAITRVDELLAVIERVRVLATQLEEFAENALKEDDRKLYAALARDLRTRIGDVLSGPVPAEATQQEKTTRVFAALHRSAEQDVTRVIDLYERWVKAGPPPLGTSMSRWWDARLAELHDALLPPPREQRERPAHPDGTPYRYHEIKAEGWGYCEGCRMWSTGTPDPHQCAGTYSHVAPADLTKEK